MVVFLPTGKSCINDNVFHADSSHMSPVIRTTSITASIIRNGNRAIFVTIFVNLVKSVCFFGCNSKNPAIQNLDEFMAPNRRFKPPIGRFYHGNVKRSFIFRFIPPPIPPCGKRHLIYRIITMEFYFQSSSEFINQS